MRNFCITMASLIGIICEDWTHLVGTYSCHFGTLLSLCMTTIARLLLSWHEEMRIELFFLYVRLISPFFPSVKGNSYGVMVMRGKLEDTFT